MDLNWSTFALEIFNFLILVWILKRFFYLPVRQAIDNRQKRIEKTLSDAKNAQAAADALNAQYEKRQSDWESEQQEARRKLQADITAEREKQMAAVKKSVDDERQKNKVLEDRRQAEIARQNEAAALQQAAQFAAKLLESVAGPDLNGALAGAFVQELKNLPDDKRAELKKACAGKTRAKIVSAFPIDKKQQDAVVQALGDVAGGKPDCEFTTDPKVIAGVRVSIGSYVLEASLQDELRFFADTAREAA